MIHFLTLLLILSSFALASEFNCSPQTTINWNQISDGVSWAKYDIQFSPYDKENHAWTETLSRSATVRVFKIDLIKNKILFHSSQKDLECNQKTDRYIKKLVDDSKAQVIGAINASFFVMPNGKIQGLALDENKVWSNDLTAQTISSSGVFSIENGIPSLETRDSFISRFGSVASQEDLKRFTFAVQAYPKLLIENEIKITDSVLNSRRPRTSIGTATNADEIVLVTIDARGENDKTGMTLFEYAHFVKTEKCGVGQKTVLNLDGGGSTSFAIPSLNIYEQADRCRHLGNILTVQKRL
jgi:hypothetical protein